jgi:Ca2+-binding RTX toxin-like protein
LGGGADTVVGGSGASTITGGSGDDVYNFLASHAGGTEVINDFKPGTDKLTFSGYATDTPVASETITGGSDIIKLTDGTEITLTGVDHKQF